MYLQGDLQAVFDALYQMGVIDPVLQMDWNEAMGDFPQYYKSFSEAISIANAFQYDLEKLIYELGKYDEATLSYLAIEVAKEFADYHSRESLH